MRRFGVLLQFTRHKHFFITTPIFYANAPPHIGHLYSAVIADAAYRWHQLKSTSTNESPSCSLFSTGTDEHGVKIQKAAQMAGIEPKIFCDNISASFRKLFKKFNIQSTDFIRTSELRHQRVVEDVWLRLNQRGFIKKAKYTGWYSTIDECFYSQQDLEDVSINGAKKKVCKSTRSPVEWIEEDNYVFEISQFYKPIRRWLLENDVIFPKHYLPLALQYLDFDETLSISRDRKRLEWGIAVPHDHTQTIYVWMDALMNYLTVSGFPNSHYEYWPPTWQVIGKDILKFHAVFWPAFLMAAELPLPRKLFVHAHWLVDGVKMSKSIGNIVDPLIAAEILTVDGLRYFLLRQGKPQDDGNFTVIKAVNVVNAELVNSLGNLLQRACVEKLNPKQIYPSFSDRVMRNEFAELGIPLIENLNNLRVKCAEHFDGIMIYKALEEISAVVRQANAFFQIYEPWRLEQGEQLSTVLYVVYETIRICGVLLQPVVPDYANKLLTRLGVPADKRGLEVAVFGDGSIVGRRLSADQEPVMRRIKPVETSNQ